MDATPNVNLFAWMPNGTAATGLFGPNGELPGIGQAWLQEMTSLLATRLRADADTLLAMGACTTLTDLALVQQRWFTEAGQTYSAASQRFAQLALQTARAATEAAVPGGMAKPTEPEAAGKPAGG